MVGGLRDGLADGAGARQWRYCRPSSPFLQSITLASKALSCQCTHESRLTWGHSKECIQRKSCPRVFKESQEGVL